MFFSQLNPSLYRFFRQRGHTNTLSMIHYNLFDMSLSSVFFNFHQIVTFTHCACGVAPQAGLRPDPPKGSPFGNPIIKKMENSLGSAKKFGGVFVLVDLYLLFLASCFFRVLVDLYAAFPRSRLLLVVFLSLLILTPVRGGGVPPLPLSRRYCKA